MNEEKYYITPESKKSKLTALERIKKVGRKVIAGVITIGALTGLAYLNSDNKSPEKYDEYINPNIKSFTIEQGANIRKNPGVKSGEDSNLIDKNEESIRIDASGNKMFYVYDKDGVNGKWYGFSGETGSELDKSNDEDGIKWVNQQGVTEIELSSDNSATK